MQSSCDSDCHHLSFGVQLLRERHRPTAHDNDYQVLRRVDMDGFRALGPEMLLTTIPPRICLIGKEEINVNRTSASRESQKFRKSLLHKALFSRAER